MTKKKKEKLLDAYEQDILDVYESGKMEQGAVSDSLITAAKATMLKNKNINIRISENDLDLLRICDHPDEVIEAVHRWYTKQEIFGRKVLTK